MKVPAILRAGIGALALGSCLTLSAAATAHGGIPRAFTILTQPGNPDRMLLRSNIWGFYLTSDGGATWQWSCAEAYEGNSQSEQHYGFALSGTGRIFVAASFDGLRYTDDLCDWTTQPQFTEELVADVSVQEDGVYVLTSTGSDQGVAVKLWRSTDDGETFTPFGKYARLDFAGSTFAFAPSDPKRIYISGGVLDSGDGIERSDDGGATWTRFTLPPSEPGPTLRIHGIHPTRPDVMFVWRDKPEQLNKNEPDELLVTADGGETWKPAYVGSGDLPGFAFTPDGTQVLVAGPAEGVRTAAVDDVIAKGTAAFTPTFDGQVWGLTYQGSTLYAGNNDFTPRGEPKFTLGSSTDDGKTFGGKMDVCDAQFMTTCGATSTMETLCRKVWDDPVKGGYLQDYSNGDRCKVLPADAGSSAGGSSGGGGGNQPDGGVIAPPPSNGDSKDDGGCSFSAGGAATTPLAASLAFVGALLARFARRRNRR